MNWLKNKLRDWLGVERNLELIRYSEKEIQELRDIIKERTEYHLDVHQYEGSQIILVGKYRNRDFLRCYSINDNDLHELIDHCKQLEKYANKGQIDCWPDITGVF